MVSGISSFATKKNVLLPIIGAVVLLLSAMLWLEFPSRAHEEQPVSYPELHELNGKPLSFPELSVYFANLAKKKGALYAFDVLKIAPTPPGIDLHLLGHIVGDELYKQKGVEGMKSCTQDFRNACSHSIVVGMLLEHGETALGQIADTCRQAPGGKIAYAMCFHGLGHGILAYAGYDLKRGIALCEQTGTPAYQNRESIECVGGAVMELVGGGFHDKNLWAEQRKIYFSHQDPLAPCNKDFMPEDARPHCYIYLTPYLWEVVGGDMRIPQEENLRRSFQLCTKIPVSDVRDRDGCFGGFGKEFVVLVQEWDIRRSAITAVTDDRLRQVYSHCRLAEDPDGIRMCSKRAIGSLYWGGQEDRSVSLRYCSIIDDTADQRHCYRYLIGLVGWYVDDKNYRTSFCEAMPATFSTECRERLLGSN